MVSGEPDGTLRIKAIVQYSAGELHSLMHGSSGDVTMEDEGTEENVSEYTEVGSQIGLFDYDTVKETGTYSLALSVASVQHEWIRAYRSLTTPMSWTDFRQMSFSLYRLAKNDLGFKIRIGIETSDGLHAYVEYLVETALPDATTWVNFVITKSDFSHIDGGISGTAEITKQVIWIEDLGITQDYDTLIDTWNFVSEASIIRILLDSEGRIEALVTSNPPTTGGHGKNTDIDEASEQLLSTSTPCKCVIVTAHPDNTAILWVGIGSSAIDEGVYLNAGDSVTLWISNVNKVYAIAEAVNQAISWVYVV